MNADFFNSNISNPAVLIPEIYKCWNSFYKWKAFQEYYPQFHKINDRGLRPDKRVQLERTLQDGSKQSYDKLEPVTRLAIPYQELITLRQNAFLTGGNINLKSNPQDEKEKATLQKVLSIWKKNKMKFVNSQIGKAIYSETECAEIWYSKVNEKKEVELKCTVYKPSDGYNLIPVFDEYRDLIAFALGYKSVRNKVEIDHLDVYTFDKLIRHEKSYGTEWLIVPFKKNEKGEITKESRDLIYGKIPVIYYQTNKSIWENVQPIIERNELVKSNLADTNDYNGSPIIAASGEIQGFSAKGETGKVLQLLEGAKVEYVSWDQSPESIKLEMETNENDIFSMTQTPNLSFREMAKLSGQLSGPIMDRILTDAHLKAKDMQNGVYGIGIQRRVNFLITAVTNIYDECKGGEDLEIIPEFELFRISGDSDQIDLLMKANGSKPILSQAESIALNPLSDNAEETLKLINDESKIVKPELPI
jgi:SPP1 family phage portal protein